MSKVKLLFDLTALQVDHENDGNGGADYAEYVFFELIRRTFYNFHAVYNPKKYTNPEVLAACKRHDIKLIAVNNNEEIRQYILANAYEKFYSALPYQMDNFDFEHTKFVMVIHGLRTIEMPSDKYEAYYAKSRLNYYKKCLKPLTIRYAHKRRVNKFGRLLSIKNKQIIVVSNYTKYSILSFFPKVREDEITVSYSPLVLDIDEQPNKSNYFLMVNADRWRKNSYRAIQAFDQLFSAGQLSDKRVVVLGSKKAPLLAKVKNKDRFDFQGYVDREALEEYFKQAFAFVYPSLNEGFGYPPLKAMRYTTPVLASSITAIPEVCADSVSYFTPYSIEEMKNKILQLDLDKDLYAELQQKGIERVHYMSRKITQMIDENIALLCG